MKFNLDESIDLLERTPAVLIEMIANLPNHWVFNNEGLDTWSPFDVLGHLIHGEETDWIPRMEIILDRGENITFVPFDRFAQFEKNKNKTLSQLLSDFEVKRENNIQILRDRQLTENDLELPGIHPELGPVKLKEVLAAWVVHDLGHIAQISRVMAKQYKDEIGPWTAYMRIANL